MLYYVKKDRLFKNLEDEIPPSPFIKGGERGIKFFFDAVCAVGSFLPTENRSVMRKLLTPR